MQEIGENDQCPPHKETREARDATLVAPLLLLPSVQVNIPAGKPQPAESDGVHYLKKPVKFALPHGR